MKFLDLFAGIGGFRLGMEMAGHKCVGHCEIDKFANASYIVMHNPKEDEWFADDITRVRADDIPRADCWCFGFPCQDISVAGKQGGFTKGKRSSLFFTVTGLIRELEKKDRPSVLFIENVKNLLSINRGVDFAKLLIELDEVGYDTEWQVLNSKDFGVPQNRERVFIIGHFRGRSGGKVFPIEGADRETTIPIKIVAHRKGYRRNLQTFDPNGIAEALDTATGGGRGHHIIIYNEDKNKNARCIDANYHKGILSNQKRTGVYNGERIRRLTPIERFRLQGFPDEYFDRARKVNSDTQLYKQAGNSVTVNVIYEIAKCLEADNSVTDKI